MLSTANTRSNRLAIPPVDATRTWPQGTFAAALATPVAPPVRTHAPQPHATSGYLQFYENVYLPFYDDAAAVQFE